MVYSVALLLKALKSINPFAFKTSLAFITPLTDKPVCSASLECVTAKSFFQ